MNNNTRAVADFCFNATVLSGVDAIDIADAFGLARVIDNDEDLFDDLNSAIDGNDDSADEVFYSRTNTIETVAARRV